MKFNAATLLPMILSVAAQVNAECKPGKTEEVVPGYNVEYGCNTCRTGNLHCSIDTIEQCAKSAKMLVATIAHTAPATNSVLEATRAARIRPALESTT
jgi:hypothetical protein